MVSQLRTGERRPPKPRFDAAWDMDLESWVVPWRCKCCDKCQMRLTGPYKFHCVQMGPYMGYINVQQDG